MDGTRPRHRSIALFAAFAILVQPFLPIAALTAASPSFLPAAVICSNATPAENSGGPQDCACAAGCGICCQHLAAVLPEAGVAKQLPATALRISSLLEFQVWAVRFPPQAPRPPPVG
jgi:hypothetical protein